MKIGRIVRQVGSTTEGLARQYDGGRLVHYQTRSTDLNPLVDRTKAIANLSQPGKSEYKFLGSIDRSVIDDWLRKQQKSWHDFATDRDLKAKFMSYYRSNFSKFLASTYQERSLAINRATAPKLGAQILQNYRAEVGG